MFFNWSFYCVVLCTTIIDYFCSHHAHITNITCRPITWILETINPSTLGRMVLNVWLSHLMTHPERASSFACGHSWLDAVFFILECLLADNKNKKNSRVRRINFSRGPPPHIIITWIDLRGSCNHSLWVYWFKIIWYEGKLDKYLKWYISRLLANDLNQYATTLC